MVRTVQNMRILDNYYNVLCSEQEYTAQMLRARIPSISEESHVKLQKILATCQAFLRQSRFGFVSLRDISRFIQVRGDVGADGGLAMQIIHCHHELY